MRCLGRIILLVLVLLLVGAGWLYRDEIRRWGNDVVNPLDKARRTGHPSPTAEARALGKVDSLLKSQSDSIILSADEMRR